MGQQLHWVSSQVNMAYSSTIVFLLAVCTLGNCGVPVQQRKPDDTYGRPQAPSRPAAQAARGPVSPPAFVPAAAGFRPQAIPSSPSTVTVTTTMTVFGPVAVETVTNTVTATQMINAGTTTDIRLDDFTTISFDNGATVTSRVFLPRRPETSTSIVTATNGQAGGVTTETDVQSNTKTVTVTNTSFTTQTLSSVSTCTIEHFSTVIDVQIDPIMMTTTIFETSTLTTVGVKRVTTTIINPDLVY